MRLTRYLVPAVAISVGAVLLIGAVATHSHQGTAHDDPVVTGPGIGTGQLAGSVARAYQFLNQMMDRHTGGTTPRLVQSYLGGLLGLDGNTSSAIYDDALVIDAYLAEGTQNGIARAEVIGNGLLYLQAHDPSHDGRIMDQYQPTALDHPGDIHVTDPTSNTGNMAWAGDALAQLYSATGRQAYLDGAVAIGDWIQAHCRDDRGPGGYTGGYTGSGSKIEWKSTEHNIDVYAFFRLLARETGNPVWSSRSAWARRFILAMWDTAAGRFNVGTTDNGATPEYSPQVEDVNSWSYLALRDPAYEQSVDWEERHLAVTADGYRGVSICTGNRTGVWFEGTAHLADALELSDEAADRAEAAAYLSDLASAQARGPNADGLGIMAASYDALSDCEGGNVYASLHTGTTAWYILAASRIDPLSGVPIPAQPGARRPQARRPANTPIGRLLSRRSRRECSPLPPLMPAQRCGRAAVGPRRSAERGTPA